MHSIEQLARLIQEVPARLSSLPDPARHPAPNKWSAKQELGHLLDSAVNNHQRIVRAQLTENPAMPGYAQDQWVALHSYGQRDWTELIQLWTALNQQLLVVARSTPESAWSRTCTIADSEPVTLKLVFEDYLAHMLHHLRHIGIVPE